MSSNKNKGKDKGKGIQKAEDYQLEVPIKIPTHNQFQTLANFPPLPYKTIVSKPATEPAIKRNDTIKLDDLKKIHQQANCTNIILNTIAEQLNHVSVRIEETHKAAKQIPKQIPTYADNISKPFFKMDSIPKKNE